MSAGIDPAVGALAAGASIDLAGRVLGGCVVAANDEAFAAAANLIAAHPATHDPAAFDARGKVYDGWETRRRRDPSGATPDPSARDWAVVRLASPAVVERVEVDTAFFRGNYPPSASLEGADLPMTAGAANVRALPESAWTQLAPRTPLTGDAVTTVAVTNDRRFSHVRLSIHPDGGVARLRVHGRPVPDPAVLTGTLDLLAAELGGSVVAASDEFYGSAAHLIRPGRAASMADGWENARRRRPGHEWVLMALAVPGRVRRVELDTTCFVHNAPARVRLLGADARAVGPGTTEGTGSGGSGWHELLDVVPAADSRQLLPLRPDGALHLTALTHLLLQVHPDGGMSRLRLWGEADDAGLAAARERWSATGP